MENTANVVCGLKNPCDFAIKDDGAFCTAGNGTCSVVGLLEAEPSDFHDQNLVEATRKIKQIIDSLPSDARGRRLSFLHTNMGTLLAWVNHGATEIPDGAVTAQDDDATVAKALRLKGYAAAGAGQA